MRVIIEYTDTTSLTQEEIVGNVQSAYGANTKITILPTSDSPEAIIYHGIQKLITEEQVQLFFDKGEFVYDEEIINLKKKYLKKLDEILIRVIVENEARIT